MWPTFVSVADYPNKHMDETLKILDVTTLGQSIKGPSKTNPTAIWEKLCMWWSKRQRSFKPSKKIAPTKEPYLAKIKVLKQKGESFNH